jgi:DNA-binding HxlR family transcriptional regulator
MEKRRSNCPMNLGIEVFGDKWSLLIIRDMMFENKRHFGELRLSEEKIASNILTDRLAMLEKEGIITKSPDPEHKQGFIYSLTMKGIDLLPILKEIGAWSIKHKNADIKKYKSVERLAKGGQEALKEIKKELIQEHVK